MPPNFTTHNSTRSSVHSLKDLLQEDGGAGKLLAHAQFLTRLTEIYAVAVPDYLSPTSRVVNYRAGIITIHADNGATAAKLRQMVPRLMEAFVSEGIKCNDLRIKTQAPAFKMSGESTGSDIPIARALSEKARTEIAACLHSLPDSPLRSTLQRLLDRARQE